MTILKDALSWLHALSVKSEAVRVIPLDFDKSRVLIAKGDDYTIEKIPPDPLSGSLRQLRDLVEVTDRPWAGKPQVWISTNQVELILDRGERRERLQYALCLANTFAALCSLRKGTLFTQEQAIDFLKYDLPESSILAMLRTVSFARVETGESERTQVGTKMGKSISNQVSGAAKIPEWFEVKTKVFAGLDEDFAADSAAAFTFEVGLDVLHEQCKFRFRSDGEALDNALRRTLLMLQAWLKNEVSDNVEVYLGNID